MIDLARVLAHPALEVPYQFNERDTMLHALATGIGMDPMDGTLLPFVYDDLATPLQALPTLPIVLGWVDLVRDPRSRDPRLGIDPDQVVVGQSAIAIHRPMPVAGTGITRTSFVQAVDKGAGRGALLCVRRVVYDAQQAALATIDTWLFVRGAGGFDGPREGGPVRTPMPARAPDAVVEQATPGNLALLYRLMLRDHNAVHADPAHAARSGFARPILHGLATFSMSLHAAIGGVTGSLLSHGQLLTSAHASMLKPVFPGDALCTEAWHENGQILFRTRVLSRSETVVDGGCLQLSAAMLK